MNYKDRFRSILCRIYSKDNAENKNRAVLNPDKADNEIWKICMKFWGINKEFDPQHPEKYNVCDNLNELQSQLDLDKLEALLNTNGWK